MLILMKMQDAFQQLSYEIGRTCAWSPGEEHLKGQPELGGTVLYFTMDFGTSSYHVYMMLLKHFFSESNSSHHLCEAWAHLQKHLQ